MVKRLGNLPFRTASGILLCMIGASSTLIAQDSADFVRNWQVRASETQADQPHWITPVFTTTPRLEQEFRYDFSWRTAPNGSFTQNYSLNKGLELIPAKRVEIILGVPDYAVHNDPKVRDGFGDASFLIKYRVASANEEKGNYIVSLFLGATVPTGSYKNGATDAILTPTIAVGKGWHNWDVQSTLGANLPTGNTAEIGHPVIWNTATQYRLFKKIWPEIETNATFWSDGKNQGKKQVFLTPGVVLGRFPIHNRLGFTVGGGLQIAATTFHTYNHQWILSLRMPF